MTALSSTGNSLGIAAPSGDALLGVNPKSKTYASDVNAALALRDWDKYKALYQPLEDILLGQVSGPANRQNAINDAVAKVSPSFDNAEESFQRQARGLGLQLTPDQEQTYKRKQDITAGLTRVQAANTAARNYDDLRRLILGGG